MKAESETKDGAIKEYIEMRGKEARKDFSYIILFFIALIVIVVWAVLVLNNAGVVPSIPVELKTCITRQVLP